MSPKSFVNIKTVYDGLPQRSVSELGNLYQQYDFLVQSIEQTMSIGPLLGEIAGKNVLLKPNWVMHNRKESDELCMRTHDNFLLALTEVVLKKEPKKLTIGDAPVQGCYWNRTVRDSFLESIRNLEEKYGVAIQIKDFRRVMFDPTTNTQTRELNPLSEYVIFDLGKESYLEPISENKRKLFRVTDYDPDRLAESHRPGVHKYCITKELFDHDIVITVPKVKTHQKAGLTNALKILVGVNGDKDFLPHHRMGGTKSGGDCYPGSNIFLRLAEFSLDKSNKKQGKVAFKIWRKISSLFRRLALPSQEQNLAAAWHGNDTTWRMVLDINKIAEYGNANGTLSNTPVRKIYSVTDGIVGGQADGPLKPEPLPLGIICFSNLSSITDVAMGVLIGFDFTKIPLLKTAYENSKKLDYDLKINDMTATLDDLKKHRCQATPPPGWVKHLRT